MVEKETLLTVLAVIQERKNLANYKIDQKDIEGSYIIAELEYLERKFRQMVRDLSTC